MSTDPRYLQGTVVLVFEVRLTGLVPLGPFDDLRVGEVLVRYGRDRRQPRWDRFGSWAEFEAAGIKAERVEPMLLRQRDRATLLTTALGDAVGAWHQMASSAEVTHGSWLDLLLQLRMSIEQLLDRAEC